MGFPCAECDNAEKCTGFIRDNCDGLNEWKEELNEIEEDTKAIYDALGIDGTLVTLAEECSELSQAALKMWRSRHNQTPVDEKTCMEALVEESADVALMIDLMIGCMFNTEEQADHFDIYSSKYDRMKVRMIDGKNNL